MQRHIHIYDKNGRCVCGMTIQQYASIERMQKQKYDNSVAIQQQQQFMQQPQPRIQTFQQPQMMQQMQPQNQGFFSKFARMFKMGGKGGVWQLHCRTCNKVILEKRTPAHLKERIAAIWHHYKLVHPTKFRAMVKKSMETRTKNKKKLKRGK